MGTCLLCLADAVEPALDLGRQPVSAHLASSSDAAVEEHPLGIGICCCCGTVQLLRPFPYRSLVPRFSWITYREPEDHLDALVQTVVGLPGIGKEAVIAGVSYKDRSTLARFRRLGFERTWCLEPKGDLEASDALANIETVHGLLSSERAAEIAARRGPVDVLIARHILEHAGAPARFLGALRGLVRDGGYLVIEVPDCEANLEWQDYTMIWEEHSLYFTPRTFRHVPSLSGCEPVFAGNYPYVFENCLVQIGRVADGHSPSALPTPAPAELEKLRAYSGAFSRWSEAYRAYLRSIRGQAGKPALYGAGHLTSAFVNFHGLAEEFAFVVDDTPQKQGLFLPKCGLPIVPRAALDAASVPVCLLGLSPENEDKVIAANTRFTDAGGYFASIFAASRRSLRHALSS